MSKKVVRILSIDGGGIRGLIPAIMLDEIEKRTAQVEIQAAKNENRDPDVQPDENRQDETGKFIPTSQLFDMIVGTSTGGILALGLTMPKNVEMPPEERQPAYSAHALAKLYREKGREIFHRSLWKRLPLIGKAATLVKAKYSPKNIQRILAERFQKTSLRDALCDVIIPSYEMGIAYPWFFKSARAKCDANYDFLMKDVALATSAAPTFFPPHHIPTTVEDEETGKEKEIIRQFIDGGVYANHPAMCAVAEIKGRCPDAQILLVSLGTGERALRYERNRRRWGVSFWFKSIFDVMFDGASDTVNYQLEQLMPFFSASTDEEIGYYRFQFQLSEKNKDMDDASATNLSALENVVREFIQEHTDKLNTLCHRLHEEWRKRKDEKDS